MNINFMLLNYKQLLIFLSNWNIFNILHTAPKQIVSRQMLKSQNYIYQNYLV